MSTIFILPSRTSIIRGPRQRARRPTASASAPKTVLNEFNRVAFRKKVYRSIDELQVDIDLWIREYNETRPHQGRWCFGKTPMQTFLDARPIAKEKNDRCLTASDSKTRSLNQAPTARSSCG